jgi:RNA-directed DNA polymerase
VPLRTCSSLKPALFKKRPRPVRTGGWYVRKAYAHFDTPLPFDAALAYVSDPSKIQNHQFYPFLTFAKSQRRFTKKAGATSPAASEKIRQLAMPSHVDGYVFAWYSLKLARLYEAALSAADLTGSVLAYRIGAGTNITMAEAAFTDIASRSASLVVALDLKDFFPSIDHKILKANWARILGTSGLPGDHFAIFRAMTTYAEVSLGSCYARLNIDAQAHVPKPICSARQFRDTIRRAAPGSASLVRTNGAPHGIPQGAQISALLSNIFMFEFDARMRTASSKMGGTYRRYSDDILFIVDASHADQDVLSMVISGLASLGPAMKINDTKTEIVRFKVGPEGRLRCDKRQGIQYLGFTFDGESRLIRSQTMSKYARRLIVAVREAKKAARSTGTKVHGRAIYRRFSHLGQSNLVSRYAHSAQLHMPGGGVRKQLRGHMPRIHKLLSAP